MKSKSSWRFSTTFIFCSRSCENKHTNRGRKQFLAEMEKKGFEKNEAKTSKKDTGRTPRQYPEERGSFPQARFTCTRFRTSCRCCSSICCFSVTTAAVEWLAWPPCCQNRELPHVNAGDAGRETPLSSLHPTALPFPFGLRGCCLWETKGNRGSAPGVVPGSSAAAGALQVLWV